MRNALLLSYEPRSPVCLLSTALHCVYLPCLLSDHGQSFTMHPYSFNYCSCRSSNM